jgi:hypothetical protein
MKHVKKFWLSIGCALFFFNIIPVCAVQTISAVSCPDFPYFRPTSGPLALINCDFHHEYEQRVTQEIQSFGAPGGRPVILNIGGSLILKYNGKHETIDITPNQYQEVKVFGHAAVSVFLALYKSQSNQLELEKKRYLASLEDHLKKASLLIPSFKLTPEEMNSVTQLATLTQNFVHKILLQGHWTDKEYNAFFAAVKPLIFDITIIASRVEISALDNALNPWLAQLSPEDKMKIGIVIATAHQSRAKEISLQYFAKKFGATFGEGALLENRITVLEGYFDESSALKLLARHYLDQKIGQDIFGDPERLQRDLLSDAAEKLLL